MTKENSMTLPGSALAHHMRALAVTLLAVALLPLGAAGTASSAERLTATKSGNTVTLKGWATFSGAAVVSAADSTKDGHVRANDAGAQIRSASLFYRPEVEDLFLRIDVTRIPSTGVSLGGVSTAGDPTTLYGFKFTIDGRPYVIRAHRAGAVTYGRTPLDNAFGLFSCAEGLCTEVAALKGGYGTTGERITVSLPMSVLRQGKWRAKEGSWMSDLLAFTAVGSYMTGEGPQPVVLDSVRMTKKPRVYIPRKSVKVTVKTATKTASLSKGYFQASFAKGLFSTSSATPVTTRTCLGTRCTVQKFTAKP